MVATCAFGTSNYLSGFLNRRYRPCFTVPKRIEPLKDVVPVTLQGQEVYRIGEALDRAGLSRSTYYRWVREGRIEDTHYRDRNGRRVFTSKELEVLRATAQRLVPASQRAVPKKGSTDG